MFLMPGIFFKTDIRSCSGNIHELVHKYLPRATCGANGNAAVFIDNHTFF